VLIVIPVQNIKIKWGGHHLKMPKQKACKICNTIYETGDKCPKCDAKESTDSFKGRIVVLNPEKSEIAKKINIKSKGNFAIKTR